MRDNLCYTLFIKAQKMRCVILEFYKILNQIMSEKNLNIPDVARLTGLSDSTIRSIVNRQSKTIALDVAAKFSNGLNLPLTYLNDGEDSIDQKKSSESTVTDSEEVTIDDFSKYGLLPIERVKIPMLGEIACGEPIFVNENRESYIESGAQIKADFCLKAKGDSMINARIHDGDIVFVRKQSMVDNGEIAVVIIDDEATLKRVYYYPESQKLVLQAENPSFEPFVYVGEELEHAHILGKAIAFQSDIM